jgi:hypothetical protein
MRLRVRELTFATLLALAASLLAITPVQEQERASIGKTRTY